jgi:hypothetical protein
MAAGLARARTLRTAVLAENTARPPDQGIALHLMIAPGARAARTWACQSSPYVRLRTWRIEFLDHYQSKGGRAVLLLQSLKPKRWPMRYFSQFGAAPLMALCILLASDGAQGARAAPARQLPAENASATPQQQPGSQSDPAAPKNPGAGPDFYADTNRGEPHQVAFFYSGVAGRSYRLEFGDGSSELMTFRYPTDCFPQIQRKRAPCPNYWAFHTYRSVGSYASSVKDSSGMTLRTMTLQVP